MDICFLEDESYTADGEEIKIFTFPSPVLKKVAEPISEITEEIKELVKNMFYTMYMAPGIGLAAPQVGKSIRLFVLDVDFDSETMNDMEEDESKELSNFNPQVFINPEILEFEGEIVYQEGCLSLPGVYEDIKRHEKIKVKYLDLEGVEHIIEADELLSICIQHELDHLNGKVFIDYLSGLKKEFYRKKLLKLKKQEI
jgi:peptide deformylase